MNECGNDRRIEKDRGKTGRSNSRNAKTEIRTLTFAQVGVARHFDNLDDNDDHQQHAEDDHNGERVPIEHCTTQSVHK